MSANRRQFIGAIGAALAAIGFGPKVVAAPPKKDRVARGFTGVTVIPPQIISRSHAYFLGCTNTKHLYDPSFAVTRTHKAECAALFYNCEGECRSGCYPKIYVAPGDSR